MRRCFLPPKGFTVLQMLDMFTAEESGLNKFDILSQRGLGNQRILQLIKQNKGKDIDIHDFEKFRNDEASKVADKGSGYDRLFLY